MDAPSPAPQQSFGTAGIAPLSRPSAVTRLFMAVVAWAERLNLRYARLGNPPVYDKAAFPWVRKLEAGWPLVRAELDRVLERQAELPAFQDISVDVRTITKDAGWKTFFLVGFGVKSQENIRRCPDTWRLVQSVPGLKTAMFSIFEPGKHLPPHRGPYNGVLRLHLPLVVPQPSERLGIRIHDEVHHWREGEALVFDDAYEHEAWNHSEGTRVVLFVDFVKPLAFPANLVNWLLMNLAMFTPFIREGLDNHRAWEKRFYAQAEAMRAGKL